MISTIMTCVKPRFRSLIFVLFCLYVSFSIVCSQTAPTPDLSLPPGQKPQDVPIEWKQLTGIFRHDSETIIILERNHSLYWSLPVDRAPENLPKVEFLIGTEQSGKFRILRSKPSFESGSGDDLLISQREENGSVSAVIRNDLVYSRVDAGSDPAQFFHITPSKPFAQLRAAAGAANPPDEPGPFRKTDLVELTTLDPAIHLDVRYAQFNNFLSTPVYPQARAFLQRPAAEALLRVLHKLRPIGYGLLIHDAYRPWYVSKIFWDATPPEDHIFVADPQKGSRHNRGCAVDLTLYDLATGRLIEMTGLYDEMSPRSFSNFPGGTSLQRWHRDLLRRAMESEGFTVNEDEWWHFDYKDWKLYPILNVPFEKLNPVSPAGDF
jgi:zinc D-Ala-D-Ala dipeptidase